MRINKYNQIKELPLPQKYSFNSKKCYRLSVKIWKKTVIFSVISFWNIDYNKYAFGNKLQKDAVMCPNYA